MTPEQFYIIQQDLISVYWPFVKTWLIFFVAAAVLAAIFIVFLVVSREMLTRVV